MLPDKVSLKKEYSDWVVINAGLKSAIINAPASTKPSDLVSLSVIKALSIRIDKLLFAWRPQIRITLSQPEALAFMAVYQRGLIVFTIEAADLYTEFDKMALSKPVEKPLNTSLTSGQNLLQ